VPSLPQFIADVRRRIYIGKTVGNIYVYLQKAGLLSMDLFQVDITGFRKFKKRTEFKTRGKVLAILGANEAGKSSLLKALTHLNSNDPFEPHEKSTGTDGSKIEIKAKFLLSDEDRKAARVQHACWFSITKYSNGERKWSISPSPADRDYSHRPKLNTEITKITGKANAASIFADKDDSLLRETVGFFSAISVRVTDLSESEVAMLSDLANRWHSALDAESPKYLRVFAERLTEAYVLESVASIRLNAESVLRKRLPEFLFFGGNDRHIKSSYAWAELASMIPDSLNNLAKIAELDLPRLIRNMTASVTDPENDNMIDKANAALIRNFREVWNQSKVSIILAKSDQYLSIHVHNNQQERTALEQRSDGLKQFVALRCFTAARDSDNLILLIDEAEQHLHYDAQADLVQMFGSQTVAAKVIYTTHSVGCLPEDLGNGVRLVEPTSVGSDWSQIENKFWKHKEGNEAAFSPILMGMGTSTMAFFPTRSAVLVEGPADTILMPTMFREALGLPSLGMQFIHGLSEDGRMQLPLLNSTGRNVCYVLDNDAGGRKLKADLLKRGLKAASIFQLLCSDGDCELEDFIDSKLLAEATSMHAAQYSEVPELVTSTEMPKLGKWDFIEQTSTKAKVKVPGKVDVAYSILEILDADPSRRILDQRLRQAFAKTAKNVHAAAQNGGVGAAKILSMEKI
jgi:predicted ATP-dependent endonuclease of OLD family